MYFRGHSFFTLVIINSDIFITECCNPFLVSLAFDLRNNFIHMRQIKDGITVSFKSSFHNWVGSETYGHRGGSRTAARSKMERFVITVNGFQLLTIITKHSILDVAAALDPLLYTGNVAIYLVIFILHYLCSQ